MSFKAELSVGGGKAVRLLHCSYSLTREVDATGRPSSANRGGTISFEIESTEDSKLWGWMIDQFKQQDGTVTFFKRDSNQKMKEVKWEKGYIVQYSESFDSVGDNPMTIHFVVSAMKITSGDATHENPWPA